MPKNNPPPPERRKYCLRVQKHLERIYDQLRNMTSPEEEDDEESLMNKRLDDIQNKYVDYDLLEILSGPVYTDGQYSIDVTQLVEKLYNCPYGTLHRDESSLLDDALCKKRFHSIRLRHIHHKELGDMRVSKRMQVDAAEHFALQVHADGELLALPLLIDGHTPFIGALPIYLVRLVTEINWDSEKECFDTFSRQTAIFYSQPNPDTTPEVMKSEEWRQEHFIFPAIRRYFLPPTSFVNNGAILQIASLSDLYKVFERC